MDSTTKYKDIMFLRSAVSRMLDCSPLTIAHRERKGIYPKPQRAIRNNYRQYSLLDVFQLQMISLGKIYIQPILSELWDMGYKNPVLVDKVIHQAQSAFQAKGTTNV